MSERDELRKRAQKCCPTCGSRERDPRHSLSADMQGLTICQNPWHDAASPVDAGPKKECDWGCNTVIYSINCPVHGDMNAKAPEPAASPVDAQRESLNRRLGNRPRKPIDPSDIGVPMCNDDYPKAPAPAEGYIGPCPKCGTQLGFGHLPEKCNGKMVPVPAEGAEQDRLDAAKRILQKACDRDWKGETLYQTAVIASNAIYWRDNEIASLREQLAQAQQTIAFWKAHGDEKEQLWRKAQRELEEARAEIQEWHGIAERWFKAYERFVALARSTGTKERGESGEQS